MTKVYANWRGGVIKNGGAVTSILGIPMAEIYAVVNDDGGAVLVLRRGLLSCFLAETLKNDLMSYFYDCVDDDRAFFWNSQDSVFG